MEEPYRWNYTIKIKTKNGTYEYEKENVIEAVKLVEQHPDYQEFYMQHKKPKTLAKRRKNEKRHINSNNGI